MPDDLKPGLAPDSPVDRATGTTTRRLSELPVGGKGVIASIGGERSVRRRLMELGLVPGTPVALVNVAPLGDPLELAVRGGRLSIRRVEASTVLLNEPVELPARRRLKVVS
jgi:ferrous iron transport protein A